MEGVGHDVSPDSDRRMTSSGDTSGEGVRDMIGAPVQNAQSRYDG